jgi:hypothetical protein
MTTYIDLDSLGPQDLAIKRAEKLGLSGVGVPLKWREWLVRFGVAEGDIIRCGVRAIPYYRIVSPSARLIDITGREDSVVNRYSSWEEWALVTYKGLTPAKAKNLLKSPPKTEKHSLHKAYQNARSIAYVFSHMRPYSPPQADLVEIGVGQISLSGPSEEYQWKLVETDEDLAELTNLLVQARERGEVIGIDVETDTEGRKEPDELKDVLAGVGIACDGARCYYITGDRLSDTHFRNALAQVQCCGHNMKYDSCVLNRHGIKHGPIFGDSMVAAYLTGERGIGLKDLTLRRYDVKMPTFAETIYPHATIWDVDPHKVAKYCCGDAYYALRHTTDYEEILLELGERLYRLYKEVQIPSISILVDMQLEGIAFDRESAIIEVGKVKEKKDAIADAVDVIATKEGFTNPRKRVTCKACRNGSRKKLTCTTCRFRGQWEEPVPFNPSPSSPNTIGLLYGTLNLPVSSVSEDTGNPTASVLALLRLRDKHPVVGLLLVWRTLKKEEEFLEAWIEASGKDSRVHTHFTNTWVRSQRLSSVDPNLQQVKLDMRRFFIASGVQ